MKGIARAEGQKPADYEAIITALSHLSQAVISDQTPGGALATAVETSAVLLQVDSSVIFLIDESSKKIHPAAVHQMPISGSKSPPAGEAVVMQCIRSGEQVIIPNISTDKRKGLSALAKMGIVSLLCVPLRVGDINIGALAVMSKSLRAFSASDIDVLGAVAAQAAFAAWKSKLLGNMVPASSSVNVSASDLEIIELANRKIQELSIVNKVSEEVISTLDPAKLLNLALDQCLVAVGANVGSIMLLDDGGKKLVIKASKGLTQDIIDAASAAVGEGIAGWVAEHGKPVLVHDAHKDPRFHLNRYRDDITSAMSVPLKARGRVIGVLNASTIETGRRYGPREVEFLSTIANQVAMAIDNAQLYDRLNRRTIELSSLLQISEAITSTLDLREVLAFLSERFMAMAQVDACALLGFDADTGRFRCLDGHGLSKSSRKSAYLHLATPVAMHALSEEKPVRCDLAKGTPFSTDVSIAERFSLAVCVPLIAAGRTVGMIALFSIEGREFPASELKMLAALGGLAGVAVHNALVYQHKYDIARSLQFQLVPKVPLAADGLEIGHKFLPAKEVGGDYYDLINIAPGRVGIVIADVAGNSVPAAMYISMSKHVLRAYAVEDNPPSGVLQRINRIACEETQPEVFISLFYGVFDASDRSFRYACAGHEPPLLYRHDGSLERLTADGILIGVTPNAAYEEKCIALEPGSVIALFTDGVVDSQNGPEKFDVDDISAIITACALMPAQQLADNIYARLIETTGDVTQDDAALVVLKVI